jgi:hypothetical protein
MQLVYHYSVATIKGYAFVASGYDVAVLNTTAGRCTLNQVDT